MAQFIGGGIVDGGHGIEGTHNMLFIGIKGGGAEAGHGGGGRVRKGRKMHICRD